MFDGYLKLGETEVVNSARAKGYGETADCPLGWFDYECEGLQEALLEDGRYQYANIDEAPWYDPRNPESARFYGAFGLGMRNISDSTRYAEVTEGITDGGVAGSPRRAGKSVRVRAWLSADGEDALEYGMSWLSAALASRRCDQHNYACGGMSARFFASCPPERRIVPGFSEWETKFTNLATNPSFEATSGTVEVYRNLATNPSFETASGTVEVRRNTHKNPRATSASGFSGDAGPGGTVTLSANTGSGLSSPAVGTYVRGTVATAGSFGEVRLTYSTDLPGVAQTTFAAYARTSGPVTSWNMSFIFYDAGGAVVDTFSVSNVDLGSPIGAGVWSRLAAPINSVPTTAVRADVTVRPVGVGAVGATVDITAIITEANESAVALRPYFDGATAPTSADFTIGWAGAANNSASVMSGTGVADVSGATTSVRSSEWSASGSRSIRVIPSKSAANPAFPNAATVYTVAESGRMTVLATARLAAAQVSPATNGRRIIAHTGSAIRASSPAAPNAAGAYPLRLTFDAVAGDTIRLTSGGIPGSGDVWWDNLLIIKGDYTGDYFDGGTAVTDPDLSASWTGTANASESALTGAGVTNMGGAAAYAPGAFSSTRWAASGMKSIRVRSETTGAKWAFIMPTMPNVAGKTYTVIGTVRTDSARRVTVDVSGGDVAQVDLLDQTVDGALSFRGTYLGVASGGAPHVAVTLFEPGDVWVDNLAVIEGAYDGPYFDGTTQGSDDGLLGYAWTGPANASTSVMQTRYPIQRPQTDAEYLLGVVAQERFLHGVSTISGPLEVQTVRSSDGKHWGREVEFTLYAEQPGIYAAPRSFGVLESIGEIVDDVVRNVVKYPSAELFTSATVVAYNHVTNPSLERDATNWKGGLSGGDDTPGSPAIGAVTAGVVKNARSYAGESSFLARWLGDGKTVGTGVRMMSIEYEQRLMPGIAAGDIVTVSVWAALVIQAGTPLAAGENVTASYVWIKADGSFVGSSVTLGTATGDDRGGRVYSLGNVTVPATATGILFRLGTTGIGAYSSPDPSVNRDIRLYADAAGVIEEV